MSVPHHPSEDAQFGTRHIAKGVGRLTNHVLKRGEGSWIYTDQGTKLLDFTTGIGVVGLGHCHPKVTAAAQDQLGNLVHAQINIGHSDAYIRFLKALLPKLALAHPSLDSVFLWNSGAEAVEAAVKLARASTGKQNVIVMQGSYHGRTLQTAGMTKSKTVYSATFHPVPPGIYTTAFPYYAQHGLPPSTSEAALVSASLHQLNLVLAQQTSPRDTAAIILEPVLGEGGYVPSPPSFLRGLRQICDQHDILLICDEVQSGSGRTGKWWSCQYADVRPDIMIFAKGIANGLPLSGIASRKELTDKQAPGSMGGTYAGNAVACAAGEAVIKTFDEEKVLENVSARSAELFDFLRNLQKSEAGALIEDVRGLGLMVGVQFVLPSTLQQQRSSTGPTGSTLNDASQNAVAADATASKEKKDTQHTPWEVGLTPRTQIAPKVVAACLKRDMLLLSTSVFDVVRFIPPLNITRDELQEGCQRFAQALDEVWQEVKGE